jgi:hypothetical protein
MCLCWQLSCYTFAIMQPRGPKSAQVQAQPPGCPRVHKEAWAKVSVVLFERQVRDLDRAAANARRRPLSGWATARDFMPSLIHIQDHHDLATIELARRAVSERVQGSDHA